MLWARIVAAVSRVALPVTESLTLNVSMTLACVERASSSATVHAKKVSNDSVIANCVFKNLSCGNMSASGRQHYEIAEATTLDSC